MLLKKVVNTVVKTGLSLSLAFTMTVQADNNQALDSFLGKLKQLQNMQADFVQVMRDGKKRELQRLSGKIMIEKPGKRSEEHTSELQSRPHIVCRLLLEKKK